MNTVVLAGGVGGAKLAHGLYRALPPDSLTVIGNTADDLRLWGLHIAPDLDTVMYTLAGRANMATGWGVAGDTFTALDMLAAYGEDTWFRLGDADFATHIWRTNHLHAGMTLTEVTGAMARALGIHAQLLPMCDGRVATQVETPDGWLEFQDYFVRRRHAPPISAVRFEGIEQATVTDAVREALAAAQVIVFAPSNPLVSIGPILAVPGLRDALQESTAVKVAVSPIVGGKALKGPADTMLAAHGIEVSPVGVARQYAGLLDGFVLDVQDAGHAGAIATLGIAARAEQTVMQDDGDRESLARAVLAFAGGLAVERGNRGERDRTP